MNLFKKLFERTEKHNLSKGVVSVPLMPHQIRDADELDGFKKGDVVRHKTGGPTWTIISFSEVMNQALAGRYTNDRLILRRIDDNGKQHQIDDVPSSYLKVTP